MPERIYRLTWGGKIKGKDIWTNGIHLKSSYIEGTTFKGFDEAANLTDIGNIIKKAYLQGGSVMANYNTLEWVKIVEVSSAGRYLNDAKVASIDNGNNIHSYNVSPQDSIVVTFDTLKKFGFAKRGRIYLPSGFSIPQTNGEISLEAAHEIATQFAVMLKELKAYRTPPTAPSILGLGAEPVVFSTPTGTFNEITEVRVGTLVDTQRRRRNRIYEAYRDVPIDDPNIG